MNRCVRFKLLGLGVLAVSALAAFPADAAPVQIPNPTQDAFVSSANPTDNFGGAGALLVAAPGLPKGEFQTLMLWDTSSVKTAFDLAYGSGNWTVTSASLQLHNSSAGNPLFNTVAAGNFSVNYQLNNSWTEGTGMPSPLTPGTVNFGSLAGLESSSDQSLGTFSYGGATTGNSNYSLTISPGFNSAATSGGMVSMRFFAADSVVSYVFNSRNFGSGSNPPVLTIDATPTPEPASIGIFAFAATALLMRRRARQ